jgi:hypothetical protein
MTFQGLQIVTSSMTTSKVTRLVAESGLLKFNLKIFNFAMILVCL